MPSPKTSPNATTMTAPHKALLTYLIDHDTKVALIPPKSIDELNKICLNLFGKLKVEQFFSRREISIKKTQMSHVRPKETVDVEVYVNTPAWDFIETIRKRIVKESPIGSIIHILYFAKLRDLFANKKNVEPFIDAADQIDEQEYGGREDTDEVEIRDSAFDIGLKHFGNLQIQRSLFKQSYFDVFGKYNLTLLPEKFPLSYILELYFQLDFWNGCEWVAKWAKKSYTVEEAFAKFNTISLADRSNMLRKAEMM